MTYNHCLYPLPQLKRYDLILSYIANNLRVPQELWDEWDKPGPRASCSFRGPGIDWSRRRLWPKDGPHEPTKAEQQVESAALWKLYDEEVKRERVAAKEICKHMTIQEAWNNVQSHLHADEYQVEAMSEADWDIYLYAKDLINQLIKLY